MSVSEQAHRDERAMALFLKSVELAGGLRNLVESRRLDWLPALMESSYIMVLGEDEQRSPNDIADLLGITSGEVEAVLRAAPGAAAQRLGGAAPSEPIARDAAAGSVARYAYQTIKDAELYRH